jgi:hypothetical protein
MNLNQINAAIRRAGLPVKAARGEGYYYFLDDEGTPIDGASVYVYSAKELPLSQWLDCARDAAILAGDD